MNDQLKYGKFRAVLGRGDDKAFAIVSVDAYGSISWDIVSEPEFSMASLDDLPQDLFAEVNTVYEQLNFSDDDIADEKI